MPNYFALYRKNDPTKTLVSFAEIDDEICKAFDITPDPVRFVYGWYDSIGFRLAIGRTLPEIKATFEERLTDQGISVADVLMYGGLIKITDYLIENYSSDSWARIGNPR